MNCLSQGCQSVEYLPQGCISVECLSQVVFWSQTLTQKAGLSQSLESLSGPGKIISCVSKSSLGTRLVPALPTSPDGSSTRAMSAITKQFHFRSLFRYSVIPYLQRSLVLPRPHPREEVLTAENEIISLNGKNRSVSDKNGPGECFV